MTLPRFHGRELGASLRGCLSTDISDGDRHDGPQRLRSKDGDGASDGDGAQVGAPTLWGWIAGAVFIIVILALVFGGEGTRTAREDASPPATTGVAPRTAPPAVAVPPAQPPSTTG